MKKTPLKCRKTYSLKKSPLVSKNKTLTSSSSTLKRNSTLKASSSLKKTTVSLAKGELKKQSDKAKELWIQARERIIKRDNGKCRVCNASYTAYGERCGDGCNAILYGQAFGYHGGDDF